MRRQNGRAAAVLLLCFTLVVGFASALDANRLGQIAMDGLRRGGRFAPMHRASVADKRRDLTDEIADIQRKTDSGAGGKRAQRDRPRRLHDLSIEDEQRGRHHAVVHHSLHPPFAGLELHDERMPFWEFGGGTVATDSYVRLTPRESGRQGYLWNSEPNAIASWEAVIGLAVHSMTPLGADGMAFWYRDRQSRLESTDSPGPMLGAKDDGFRGLGVMLDSYDNNNGRDGPRVQVVYRPPGEHSPLSRREFPASQDFAPSLDDDSDMDPNAPDSYGCAYNFRGYSGDTSLTVLKVRYDATEKTLSVTIRNAASDSEVQCATLRAITLPTGNYFGFTAETGGLSDHHDVAFFHLTPHSSLSEEEQARRDLEELISHEAHLMATGTTPWIHHGGFDHRADQLERIKHRVAAPDEKQAWASTMRQGNAVKEQYPHGAAQHEARQAIEKRKAALAAKAEGRDVDAPPRVVLEELASEAAERHLQKTTPEDHIESPELAEFKRTGAAQGHAHDARRHEHHHHGGDGTEPVPEGEDRFFKTIRAKLEAKQQADAAEAAAENVDEQQQEEAAPEDSAGADVDAASEAVPPPPPPPGATGAKHGRDAHGDDDVIRGTRVRGRNGRVGRRGGR